jgi:hypothetical protein
MSYIKLFSFFFSFPQLSLPYIQLNLLWLNSFLCILFSSSTFDHDSVVTQLWAAEFCCRVAWWLCNFPHSLLTLASYKLSSPWIGTSRCMVPERSTLWNSAFPTFWSHHMVSSMTLVPRDASLRCALFPTVDWLSLNYHAHPRRNPFHFPLFNSSILIRDHPATCAVLYQQGNTSYAIYLTIWMQPSTPCTITATRHTTESLTP